MNFTATQSTLRTVTDTDPNFTIRDGFIVAKRAGFIVSDTCPTRYRQIITQCIMEGWLRPVATVRDTELFWEEFHK